MKYMTDLFLRFCAIDVQLRFYAFSPQSAVHGFGHETQIVIGCAHHKSGREILGGVFFRFELRQQWQIILREVEAKQIIDFGGRQMPVKGRKKVSAAV
jgi:hypothetical protein